MLPRLLRGGLARLRLHPALCARLRLGCWLSRLRSWLLRRRLLDVGLFSWLLCLSGAGCGRRPVLPGLLGGPRGGLLLAQVAPFPVRAPAVAPSPLPPLPPRLLQV